MTRREVTNPAASVRQRLLNGAETRGEDFNITLMHYAIERLLYRLDRSDYRERFVLKGAMLFRAWGGDLARATTDLDLLGYGNAAPDALAAVFREVVAMESDAPDGLVFDSESIDAEPIREGDEYDGVRLRLWAHLGSARIRVQVDVGTGDAVYPAPQPVQYPTLLDQPAPRLRAYPKEAVVAEKLHAITVLGMINTRLKDFHDLWVLSRRFPFAGSVLRRAVEMTFMRRATRLPAVLPEALTRSFLGDPTRGRQWRAFLSRTRVTEGAHLGLLDVGRAVGAFVGPVLIEGFEAHWPPGGPWREDRAG
jgi:predicted nucleotidyltransferase component of viral defense system